MKPANKYSKFVWNFVDAELYREKATFIFLRRGQSVSEQDKTHIFEALSDNLKWIKSLELGNLKYYRHRDLPRILVTSNKQAHLHKITCD